MPRYPLSFAERNKVLIAIGGIAAMVIVFLVTFNAASLPVVGNGDTYTAEFRESGGLREGNDVRVAGVKVGEVTDVRLDKDKVVVSFQVKGVHLGDQTTAAVKVRTLLGRKYLSLSPQGRGDLDGRIPVSRTTTPYDVNAAFSDFSDELTAIDTPQLEKSLRALSTAFEDTPAAVRDMVDGLSALSRTISTRDEELATLLDSTTSVTGTLAERNDEFAKIMQDGAALLEELANRREAVHDMLTGTARLGTELQGLVADNEKTLAPALDKLDRVSGILQRNQDHLEEALRKMGPYYRVLASATGNGRWVDSYLCGLFDSAGVPVLENDVLRNCQPRSGGGR